ncbi:TPA: hypothetical protein CPT80_07630 [Candidatus Gastranaerophilales bacterium HUM_9]|nr:MAG TPA: hypothetical protein CPT80_07630 [Candidatus Gastranaerophilales bacterium HUM_9]HBX35139.1 hypothetical protein [Cyanobacteria bacterium UBA11440]
MSTNWEAVSAIGSICGSIATFLAVVVALWQTSLKSKSVLKFNFSPCARGIGYTGAGKDVYIHLSVSNFGQPKVKIVSWGIILNDNYTLAFMSSCMGNIGNDLPIELLTGETADLFFSKKTLTNYLVEASNNKLLFPNSRLCFFVNDRAGKSHYYKTKVKIKTFLKNYNNEVIRNEN